MATSTKDSIYHLAQGAFGIFAPDYSCLYHSEAWSKLHHEQRRMEGKSLFDMFPGTEPYWRPVLEQVAEGASLSRSKSKLVMKDGTVRWLSWEAGPWREQAGGPVSGSIISISDHTHEVVAGQRQGRVATHFEQAFSLAGLAYWVYYPARNWIQYSAGLPAMLGLPSQAFPGGSDFDDLLRGLPIGNQAAWKEMLGEQNNTRREWQLHLKGAAGRPGLLWIKADLPQTDPASEETMISGLCQDISQWNMQAKPAEENSALSFPAALEQAKAILAPDFSWLYFNDSLARVLHLDTTPSQPPLCSLAHPEDRPGLENWLIEQFTLLHPTQSRYLRLRKGNQGYGWFQLLGQTQVPGPVHDSRHLYLILLECSDLHQELDQLRQENHRLSNQLQFRNKALEEALASWQGADKYMEKFVYSIAHDLRAPIRHLQGYSQLIIENHLESIPEEVQQYVGYLQQSGNRLGKMIDELINYAKDASGQLYPEWVDLEQIWPELLNKLALARQAPVLNWELDVRAKVWGDPQLVKLILLEVLDNAVKFSSLKPEAVIIFSAYYQETGTCVMISDNGVGFDMKYYGKLFGIFERLHHQDELGGFGIGLAKVKRAMERQRGQIWAQSEVDKGTTFFLSFPGQG